MLCIHPLRIVWEASHDTPLHKELSLALLPFGVLRLPLGVALLLLTLQLGLLLTLHLGHALHEAVAFARLLLVRLELGQQLVFVDEVAERGRLQDGDQRRDEEVVAQPRGILVEDEEEHHGHHVRHHGHAGHLLLTGVAHVHVDLGVDHVDYRHQQTEEADVVTHEGADERNVGVPRDDGVERREVFGPEERLLTQLDSRREKPVERDEDRHLEQHRQATTHRAGPGTTVQLHRGLLPIHRLLLLRIAGVDRLHLRPQHTHLGRGHVRLVRQREEHQLDDERKDEDDHTVVGEETAEVVEDGHDEVAVDGAHPFVAQRHELVERKAVGLVAALIVGTEEFVLVRADEIVEADGVGLRRVEVDARHGREGLQMRRVCVGRQARLEFGSREGIVGNEHRGEVLVLVADPLQAVGDLLVRILRLAQLVHVVGHVFIVKGRVLVLVLPTVLQLARVLRPGQVERAGRGSEDAIHAGRKDRVAQHVIVRCERVGEVHVRTVARVKAHGDRATIGALDRREVEVGRVDDALVGRDHRQVESRLVRAVEEHERLLVVGGVFLQSGVAEAAALGADAHLHLVVLEGDKLLRTDGCTCEGSVCAAQALLTHGVGQTDGIRGRCRSESGCGLRLVYLSQGGLFHSGHRVVVTLLRLDLFLTRAVEPDEKHQHHPDQYETDHCILIH